MDVADTMPVELIEDPRCACRNRQMENDSSVRPPECSGASHSIDAVLGPNLGYGCAGGMRRVG